MTNQGITQLPKLQTQPEHNTRERASTDNAAGIKMLQATLPEHYSSPGFVVFIGLYDYIGLY